MKYLKKYEYNVTPYKFNRYSYVKISKGFNKYKKHEIYKITDRYENEGINNYHLKSIISDTSFWEYQANMRELTPDEKEELEMILNKNKYNL